MMPQFSNENDLEDLCRAATPEGLNLEFKEKEDPSNGALNRSDKRAIAEVVSAFANSDGGTIIFGIGSETRDGLDVAARLAPIHEIDRALSEFQLVCALNISPALDGISPYAVKCDGLSGQGYIVCEVTASQRRPHMSTAQNVQRYYKRSFVGNEPMTPSEIRDQILSVRESAIDPRIFVTSGSSFGRVNNGMDITCGIQFSIVNVGDRACVNPFLRIKSSEPLDNIGGAEYDSRLGAWKSSTTSGELIHSGDEFICFFLACRAFIPFELMREADTPDKLLASVQVFSADSNSQITNIIFTCTYGAENATARNIQIMLDRDEIARAILVRCERAIAKVACEYFPWRADLISELAQQLHEAAY